MKIIKKILSMVGTVFVFIGFLFWTLEDREAMAQFRKALNLIPIKD